MLIPSVMIVEDEGLVALALEEQLQRLGYQVTGIAASGGEALKLARTSRPQMAIMDIRIQGQMDGIATAVALRRQYDIPVVFTTAHTEDATLVRAREAEPLAYLVKPVAGRELHSAIQVAMQTLSAAQIQKQEHSWVRRLLDCMREGVVILDMEGRVQFMNKAAEILVGTAHGCVRGTPASQVLRFRTSGGRTLPRAMDRMLATGGGVALPPDTVIVSEAGAIPVEDSAAPILDCDGRPVGLMLVLRDVSAQRCMQNELKDSISQLSGRCAELEGLARQAAADVQEHMKEISCFAAKLISDRAPDAHGQPHSPAAEILLLSSEASRTMTRYADLSAIAGATLNPEYVDISALAESLTAREPGLELSVEPGLCCYTDQRLLQVALDNLFKHFPRTDGANGRTALMFGLFAETESAHTFFIRSAPLSSDETAQPSERQVAAAPLTTAQRALTRLGGGIWSEDSACSGPAVYFTLPMRPPASIEGSRKDEWDEWLTF